MLAEWTSLYQQQMLAFTKATRILTQSHLGAWVVEELVFLHGFWSQHAHVEAWVVQPQRNDVIVDAQYNANYIQLPIWFCLQHHVYHGTPMYAPNIVIKQWGK